MKQNVKQNLAYRDEPTVDISYIATYRGPI